MDHEPNPYAAPQVESFDTVPPVIDSDAERIRREYLSHETSLRSWGTLYLVSGGFFAVGAIVALIVFVALIAKRGWPGWSGISRDLLIVPPIYGLFSAALIPIGRGLRSLNPKIRRPTVLVSVLGLLLFPFGTVVGAVVLYLLLGHKGRMVLSPEYAEIRRQTPHIVYRTPPWNWIVAGLFVASVAGLLAYAFAAVLA